MEIVALLHEIALQKYPIGIDCLDSAYDLHPKVLELTKAIKDERKKMSIKRLCDELNKNFKGCYFRDTTYLYNTNPSIRIELIYRQEISKILISFLYPIFSIIGEFKKEKSQVQSVLGSYTFIDDVDLRRMNMNTVSANQKPIRETTLFDCFFHDN